MLGQLFTFRKSATKDNLPPSLSEGGVLRVKTRGILEVPVLVRERCGKNWGVVNELAFSGLRMYISSRGGLSIRACQIRTEIFGPKGGETGFDLIDVDDVP